VVFESFAQNGEDVVLWRALNRVVSGRYIDVGSNHPTVYSISFPFYTRGWRGLTIDPVHEFVEMHRAQRPGDIAVEAAITSTPGDTVTLHEIAGTGLSTLDRGISAGHEAAGWDVTDVVVPTRTLDSVLEEAGWEGSDIHFMTVDTEGSEAVVLRSIDLRRWRPWVLVIEATRPGTVAPAHEAWEPIVLEAGYRFCLFDGLSRFYLAEEHDDIAERLSYPACILDDFRTHYDLELDAERLDAQRRAGELTARVNELTERLRATTADLVRWRAAALSRWANGASGPPVQMQHELAQLREQLAAMRETVSWRVTKPLRAVRGRVGSAYNAR
jgi:FkbM family methyltransferase